MVLQISWKISGEALLEGSESKYELRLWLKSFSGLLDNLWALAVPDCITSLKKLEMTGFLDLGTLRDYLEIHKYATEFLNLGTLRDCSENS